MGESMTSEKLPRAGTRSVDRVAWLRRLQGVRGSHSICLTASVLAIAQGCSSELEDEFPDRLSAQAAEVVLGFESGRAWRSDSPLGPRDGEAGSGGVLAVEVASEAHLESASFAFSKTPNQLSLTLRPPPGAAPLARVGAFLSCPGRAVYEEPVATAALGLSSAGDEPTEVKLVVPSALQARLAGGCEDLIVKIAVYAEARPGLYELSHLKLRSESPRITTVETPLCGLPSVDHLVASARETEEGYWDFQAWLLDPVPQAELHRLAEALDTVSDLVLEPVFDDLNQEVVIAVEPDDFRSGAVEQALAAGDIALPMRVQPACHSLRELKAKDAEFGRLDWQTIAPNAEFSTYLDSARAALILTVDDGQGRSEELVGPFGTRKAAALPLHLEAARVIQTVMDHMGNLAEVRFGKWTRRGRLSDGQPHYGGALVFAPNSDEFCTAGFIVRRNGALGAVTAGHCFENGDIIYSGPSTGPQLYGLAAGRAPFPRFDLIRIDAIGQRFSNVIHADPGRPTRRKQVGKRDPYVGEEVCVSGVVTGSKCGAKVDTHTERACSKGQCTYNLTHASRVGVVIGQHGDSGAPVYKRSGDDGALILGMEVGGRTSSEVVFHRVSQVESTLGVRVAL